MINACDEGVLSEVVNLITEDLLLELIFRLEFDASWGCHNFSAGSRRY